MAFHPKPIYHQKSLELRNQTKAMLELTQMLLETPKYRFCDQLLRVVHHCKQLLQLTDHLLELQREEMVGKRSSSGIRLDRKLSANEQFLRQLTKILDENLENEHFGIPHLCKQLMVSRTQLHRKVKTASGLSTSLFVRQFRLKKAKSLLENSDLQVSEVAYRVGFKNPEYFSRKFSEVFGLPPSSFTRNSRR